MGQLYSENNQWIVIHRFDGSLGINAGRPMARTRESIWNAGWKIPFKPEKILGIVGIIDVRDTGCLAIVLPPPSCLARYSHTGAGVTSRGGG